MPLGGRILLTFNDWVRDGTISAKSYLLLPFWVGVLGLLLSLFLFTYF